MTITAEWDTTTVNVEDRGARLAERLFGSALAGAELLTVELGRRLGLYAVLHGLGPSTAADLAAEAGIASRYAREWLEQQAAAGLIDVAEDTGDADTRRFELPAAHVPVLLDSDDPSYLMGAAPMLTGAALPIAAVAAAYRTGEGVDYAAYGAEIRHGIEGLNRPVFAADLTTWLAALPDVLARLQTGGRVLDAGCGTGWSTIILAQAFPMIQVHGVDMDAASIQEARANAVDAGVADRVTFELANVAELSGGSYELICVFEALHDMGEPIEALRRLRSVLAPEAPVLVADERVADEFTAPAGEVERFQYAYSVLHCLPATMAESTNVASGTVLRTPMVRAWAQEAGYTSVDVLPVETDFWRLYRFNAG